MMAHSLAVSIGAVSGMVLDRRGGGVGYNVPMLLDSRKLPELRVPLATFVKFCHPLKAGDQLKTVKDQLRFKNRKGYVSPYSWHRLFKTVIHDTHARIADPNFVDAAFADKLGNPKLNGRDREVFELLSGMYMDYIRGRRDVAETFLPDKWYVDLDDLAVLVDPELGIRTTLGHEQVLKLWLQENAISRSTRETMSYLLQKAKQELDWPYSRELALLDVRRASAVSVVETDDHVERRVRGEAARFSSLWRSENEKEQNKRP